MPASVLGAIGLVLNAVQSVLKCSLWPQLTRLTRKASLAQWIYLCYFNVGPFSNVNKVRHLETGDKDLASVIAGDLALLYQRDCRHQSLNCRGKFPIGRVLKIRWGENSNIQRERNPQKHQVFCADLDCPGNGRAGNCPVSAHDLLKLRLRQTMGHLSI